MVLYCAKYSIIVVIYKSFREMKKITDDSQALWDFLHGKSPVSIDLFHHFVSEFRKIGAITVHPAATMIGIATERKRIAYVTQFGKSFIHVVLPFEVPYEDNLCFQKIAQVPNQKQFNHHFRMLSNKDVNAEVKKFMRAAFEAGS
jgi:hypothetical protein